MPHFFSIGTWVLLFVLWKMYKAAKPAYQRLKHVSYGGKMSEIYVFNNLVNFQVHNESFPQCEKSLHESISEAMVSPKKTIEKVVHRLVTPMKLFVNNLTKPDSKGPCEMNLLIEPFFCSKWVSKNGGNGEGTISTISQFFMISNCTISFIQVNGLHV